MPLPTLTHLQFLVLSKLLDGEIAGRELREKLANDGVKKGGPAFYQLMSRLEDSDFVEGWYEENVIDGQMIRERHYRLTGQGQQAYQEACEFYAARAQSGLERGLWYAR